jgi:thiamine monophosphate kinase
MLRVSSFRRKGLESGHMVGVTGEAGMTAKAKILIV